MQSGSFIVMLAGRVKHEHATSMVRLLARCSR
jgi:hypothetical protein